MRTGEDKETAWDEGRVLVAAVWAFTVSVDVDIDISSTELDSEHHLDELSADTTADLALPDRALGCGGLQSDV